MKEERTGPYEKPQDGCGNALPTHAHGKPLPDGKDFRVVGADGKSLPVGPGLILETELFTLLRNPNRRISHPAFNLMINHITSVPKFAEYLVSQGVMKVLTDVFIARQSTFLSNPEEKVEDILTAYLVKEYAKESIINEKVSEGTTSQKKKGTTPPEKAISPSPATLAARSGPTAPLVFPTKDGLDANELHQIDTEEDVFRSLYTFLELDLRFLPVLVKTGLSTIAFRTRIARLTRQANIKARIEAKKGAPADDYDIELANNILEKWNNGPLDLLIVRLSRVSDRGVAMDEVSQGIIQALFAVIRGELGKTVTSAERLAAYPEAKTTIFSALVFLFGLSKMQNSNLGKVFAENENTAFLLSMIPFSTPLPVLDLERYVAVQIASFLYTPDDPLAEDMHQHIPPVLHEMLSIPNAKNDVSVVKRSLEALSAVIVHPGFVKPVLQQGIEKNIVHIFAYPEEYIDPEAVPRLTAGAAGRKNQKVARVVTEMSYLERISLLRNAAVLALHAVVSTHCDKLASSIISSDFLPAAVKSLTFPVRSDMQADEYYGSPLFLCMCWTLEFLAEDDKASHSVFFSTNTIQHIIQLIEKHLPTHTRSANLQDSFGPCGRKVEMCVFSISVLQSLVKVIANIASASDKNARKLLGMNVVALSLHVIRVRATEMRESADEAVIIKYEGQLDPQTPEEKIALLQATCLQLLNPIVALGKGNKLGVINTMRTEFDKENLTPILEDIITKNTKLILTEKTTLCHSELNAQCVKIVALLFNGTTVDEKLSQIFGLLNSLFSSSRQAHVHAALDNCGILSYTPDDRAKSISAGIIKTLCPMIADNKNKNHKAAVESLFDMLAREGKLSKIVATNRVVVETGVVVPALTEALQSPVEGVPDRVRATFKVLGVPLPE